MATETKSQRLTRQMKKDAERQARRRAKMVESGKPETHAVDRALAEALAYVVTGHHQKGTKRGNVQVPFMDVLKVASRILAHRGRFDLEQAMRAVVARTRSHDRHWTLETPTRPET